jgi:hypothetical protein
MTVAMFLDRYYTSYVQAEALRSAVTINSRLKMIKSVIGDLPVAVLEKPAEILRFKASYREGHNIATVNRALSTLRAAINWGRFQDPPILSTSPFHRFGVSIKAKEETKRDRRIGTDEEQSLLSAAQVMNSTEHKFQIDLHWHDLRHEGACRLLADGVDIRTILTDEELRKAMTGVGERRRRLKAVGQ